MKPSIKKRPYRTYYGNTIKTIFNKFIKPFIQVIKEPDEDIVMSAGVRRFFNVDTRSLYFAKAKRPFTIPGKEWLDGIPSILGYSNGVRQVAANDSLVLRFDELEPDKIELEFEDRIFVMNKEMWQKLEVHVELIG